MKSNPAVGTVTDMDGNFSLKASLGDVLVFTFIGYEPIEYKLTAADTNLKVRFTDSSELLDEVVVVDVYKRQVWTLSFITLTGFRGGRCSSISSCCLSLCTCLCSIGGIR